MTGKHRYVALIRGINVGGNSIIKMDKLKSLFESAGLTDIVTYIQSGNVLFSTIQSDRSEISKEIEEKLVPLTSKLVKVFVFSQPDLQKAANNNPFACKNGNGELVCHLMFMSDEPEAAKIEALTRLQGEEYRFHVTGNVLYYSYLKQYAGNRQTINFEKILGVTGTSRTWKVVDKLIELLN